MTYDGDDDVRGEEYEAAKDNAYGPHDDPCDCDVCRRAVGSLPRTDSGTHLPECAAFWPSGDGFDLCICDRLRACEARMLDTYSVRTSSWQQGFDSGAQAAREAVAAVHRYGHLGFDVAGESVEGCSACGEFDWPCSTLAAIDALKEKP